MIRRPPRWRPRMAVTALALTACAEFVGLEGLELIPPLPQLDYGAIGPAQPYDYWELRTAFAFTARKCPRFNQLASNTSGSDLVPGSNSGALDNWIGSRGERSWTSS